MKGDEPVGILTTSDIIRHLSTSPTLIATDIYKANSVDALTKIRQQKIASAEADSVTDEADLQTYSTDSLVDYYA